LRAVAPRCGGSSIDVTSASKKTLYAVEQKRADVVRARRRWMREQGMFDPARLVFIDETGASAQSGRAHDPAPLAQDRSHCYRFQPTRMQKLLLAPGLCSNVSGIRSGFRIVLSSVMRWRNGLINSSVPGMPPELLIFKKGRPSALPSSQQRGRPQRTTARAVSPMVTMCLRARAREVCHESCRGWKQQRVGT
jgi:hypothetical protein